MLTHDQKELLESYESTVDNVVHEITSILSDTIDTNSLYDSYIEFRDKLQKSIKASFPEGTKFGNF